MCKWNRDWSDCFWDYTSYNFLFFSHFFILSSGEWFKCVFVETLKRSHRYETLVIYCFDGAKEAKRKSWKAFWNRGNFPHDSRERKLLLLLFSFLLFLLCSSCIVETAFYWWIYCPKIYTLLRQKLFAFLEFLSKTSFWLCLRIFFRLSRISFLVCRLKYHLT